MLCTLYGVLESGKCYRTQKNSSKGEGECQVAVFSRVVRLSLTEKAVRNEPCGSLRGYHSKQREQPVQSPQGRDMSDRWKKK